MMVSKDTIYMRLIVSYGKPTDFDSIGCDGLYIESCEKKTKEVSKLKTIAIIATDILENGLSVSKRRELRNALAQLAEEKEDD